MIKAQDLRIDAWVFVEEFGHAIKIKAIGEDGEITGECSGGGMHDCMINDLSPIPLTPELLGKIEGCELVHDGRYRLTWELKHRERFITIRYGKHDKTWSVTFVSEIILQYATLHWLQNVLYFNWDTDLSITL